MGYGAGHYPDSAMSAQEKISFRFLKGNKKNGLPLNDNFGGLFLHEGAVEIVQVHHHDVKAAG